MTFEIRKATKTQSRLRMALFGPSGSGKTYTALSLATELGERVCLIDTEHGSSEKYADLFEFDVLPFPGPYSPQRYIEALEAAHSYPVVVIDSLSHAWEGTGGVKEIADQNAIKGNTWAGWSKATPQQNRLVEAMLGTPFHLICTMRSKTEWIPPEKGKAPEKVGTAPVQRDGMEYEFDVAAMLDTDHTLRVTKTRLADLDGAVIQKPGKQLAGQLSAWLGEGVELPPLPDMTKLEGAIARGKKIEPDRDWRQDAEKAAQREFGHSLMACSQTEVDDLAKSIGLYVKALEKAAA